MSSKGLTQANPAGQTATPPRILVAEDNLPMRRMITELLSEAGYQITEVRDGHELSMALAAQLASAKAPRYSAVVSDVRMPGTTGVDVLRSLRERDRSTPFLFITAYASDSVRADAVRLGAYVFDKPFDPYHLVTFIRCLVPPDETA